MKTNLFIRAHFDSIEEPNRHSASVPEKVHNPTRTVERRTVTLALMMTGGSSLPNRRCKTRE